MTDVNEKVCDARHAGAFGHCSSDRVEVFHGYTDPAIGCGRHVTYDIKSVFDGHKLRMIDTTSRKA